MSFLKKLLPLFKYYSSIKEIKPIFNHQDMELTEAEKQQQTEQQQIPTEENKPKEEEEFNVGVNGVTSTNNKEIDYNKLIEKFGCSPLTEAHVQRIQKLTGK